MSKQIYSYVFDGVFLGFMVYDGGLCNMLTQILYLCSWSAAYQTVLVTNKPFPRPVPLHVRYNAF
jgi:hypothetical protein